MGTQKKKKKKKAKFLQVIGLGVSNCIITSWRRKCALGSITIRGSRVELKPR